jgi:hypothetical protein
MSDISAFEIFLLLVFLWHLSHQAGRLDRLHHRIEVAHAALDGHLARRAAIVAELGTLIDNQELVHIAHKALTISPTDFDARSIAENRMMAKLHEVFADGDRTHALLENSDVAAMTEDLKTDNLRVQLSRRFHAEAVRAALHLRDQRLVRWFHLAGRAQRPTTLDFADSLPISLGN